MFHPTTSAPKKHAGLRICLLCCAALLVLLFLWELLVFSICPGILGVPGQQDIPPGEFTLASLQFQPTQKWPVTFQEVTVEDLATEEALAPTLGLSNEEKVQHLSMGTGTGTIENLEGTAYESPLLPVAGTTLTSSEIALAVLWPDLPPVDHATEYTIHYRVFGLFPKTERLVFHWDTAEEEVTYPSTGPIAQLQAWFA